ncbi:MAG: hypothetical protein KGJ80_21320 [Chloroflexota bacterium]|nr:hypothetical protein [Chloroflexota bacterium]
MKVQTNLKAGITVEEIMQSVQSGLASAGSALGSAAQGLTQQAQAVLSDPNVSQAVETLKWWPFGPPKL